MMRAVSFGYVLSMVVGIVSGSLRATESAASPILVKRISAAQYEITVSLQGATDVNAAQDLLIAEARKLCGAQPFNFGHYSFNSTAPISNTTGSPGLPPTRLTLTQEVVCGAVATQANAHISYAWTPTDSDSQLVAARTQGYLAQKDRGELDLAYGQFSDSMKSATHLSSWSANIRAFNSEAGAVEFRKIIAVSWVKDPAGVDPGFYAAVDYVGKYGNVPYECGYVAWYREISGQLSIVREEDGFINRDSASGMTPAALRDALAQIHCAGS